MAYPCNFAIIDANGVIGQLPIGCCRLGCLIALIALIALIVKMKAKIAVHGGDIGMGD
ncbi:hypothetical protein AO375_0584 [Moraxella catarrhalis]|nr:hypothetical protein AO375_0584 [Moraxella catarrhalis]